MSSHFQRGRYDAPHGDEAWLAAERAPTPAHDEDDMTIADEIVEITMQNFRTEFTYPAVPSGSGGSAGADTLQAADVLQAAVNAAVKERDALRSALRTAQAALCSAGDYFEDRQDEIDGDYGVPEPNKEMRLAAECDEALGLISLVLA